MRFSRRYAFVIAMLLTLFCYSAFADKFPVEAVVSGDSVHVRAGDSTKFEVLGTLNNGAKIVVVGLSSDFYQIKAPQGIPIFIFHKYITVSGKVGTVVGKNVNLRARPVNGTVVCQLSEPTKLNILEKKDDWYAVEAPPQAKVFIHKDYVKIQPKQSETPKPSVTPIVPTPNPEVENKWKTKYSEAEKFLDEQLMLPVLKAEFDKAKKSFEQILAEPLATDYHHDCKRKIALCEFYIKQQQALRDLKDKNKELEDRLKELKEELDKKLKELADEKAKKEEDEEKFVATGHVFSIGGVLNRPATHRLVKGDKVLYLMKSSKFNLDDYWGLFVGVNGTVSPAPKGWEASIIDVTEIKVLDATKRGPKPKE